MYNNNNNLNLQNNNNNYFHGNVFLSENKEYIYNQILGQEPKIIGVNVDLFNNLKNAYSDLEETTNSYYQKLVEVGVFKKELTIEEKLQNLQEENNKKVEELTNSILQTDNKINDINKNINSILEFLNKKEEKKEEKKEKGDKK